MKHDFFQIEGVIVPSDRTDKVVCLDGYGDPRDSDPISRLDLKDVRTLFQFLRPDATILPRSVTGLSLGSQKYVELLIERAQNAGLIPLHIKPNGEHIYKERDRHQFNVYYDSVIGLPKFSMKKPKYVPPD